MIHIFVGTKAQLIKMAPIMRELDEREVEYNFVFSGQHRETVNELLDCFSLKPPDCKLYDGPDITGIGQMIAWGTRLLLAAQKEGKRVWQADRRGIVLVHGDTASTLLGALLARLNGLRCAHVESGLNSGTLLSPFPEEIIRRIVFRLSNVLFAPGDEPEMRLKRRRARVINTRQNTLIDSLRLALDSRPSDALSIPKGEFALVSLHRFENIFSRKRLLWLCRTLTDIARKLPVLFILHKPTAVRLDKYGLKSSLERTTEISLRPRYDYVDFIHILNAAALMITDGGSNQEECYYLGKPCLIMRDETERSEGLGSNALLSKYDLNAIHRFVNDWKAYEKPPPALIERPSEIIVDELTSLGYA